MAFRDYFSNVLAALVGRTNTQNILHVSHEGSPDDTLVHVKLEGRVYGKPPVEIDIQEVNTYFEKLGIEPVFHRKDRYPVMSGERVYHLGGCTVLVPDPHRPVEIYGRVNNVNQLVDDMLGSGLELRRPYDLQTFIERVKTKTDTPKTVLEEKVD